MKSKNSNTSASLDNILWSVETIGADYHFAGEPTIEVEMTGIKKGPLPNFSGGELSSYIETKLSATPFKIKDVIFNGPATIVKWSDGTKTVVKTQDGEEFDPEKGWLWLLLRRCSVIRVATLMKSRSGCREKLNMLTVRLTRSQNKLGAH